MDEIGRYKVVGTIGHGGFATVFDGRDPVLDSRVAIKVLETKWSLDLGFRERFINEARLLRKIGSDRLITIYDIGELEGGQPYFVMEYAGGGTLDEVLGQRMASGELPTDDLRWLVNEMAACLGVVHSAGIIHRDVKPSNLLYDPARHRLKLADFGLAKDTDASGSRMTMAGGSAGYMAPEQGAFGSGIDLRADLYAATAVLHWALTGEHRDVVPHEARRPKAWYSLPDDVVRALEIGLALEPDQRPPTAEAWRTMCLAALESRDTAVIIAPQTVLTAAQGPGNAGALQHPGPVDGPGKPSHRRSGRWLVPAGAALLLAVLAVVFFVLTRGGSGPTIDGPDQAEAGTTISLSGQAADADSTLLWITPDGGETAGEVLDITPKGAGAIDVELVEVGADGSRSSSTRTIEVTLPADAPSIEGPDEVAVGDTATFEARGGVGATFVWDPRGDAVTSETLQVTPSGEGSLTLVLQETDNDGRVLIVTKRIAVRGS